MTQSGDIVGGKYRLVYPLGEGGMGVVWRAEHVHLEQAVAIKLLDVRGPNASSSVERFLREGRIAAAIRHRNVVRISDYGEDQGAPYLVMELLQGVPLSERLQLGEPLTVAAFLQLMLGTLDGLGAVHSAGIVHRDIKPENIFLVHDPDGDYAKLLDFGLSRTTESGHGHTITRDGVVPGTLEYISPEQARGNARHDLRCDIYSLGVVMYEALAGRRPIEADNAADAIVALLNSDPVPLAVLRPDLPDALSRFVMTAMARKPADRYRHADEMRRVLGALVANLGEAGSLCLRKQRTVRTSPSTHPMQSDPPDGYASPGAAVEAQRSGAPRSLGTLSWAVPKTRTRLLAAGVVMLLGLASMLYLSRSQQPPSRAVGGAATARPTDTETSRPVALPPEHTDPAPRTVQAPPHAAEVSIELAGLPDEAKVTVDGEPAQGPTLRLQRGSGTRRIRVSAPGRRSWAVEHDAREDGSYQVRLERVKHRRKARRPRKQKTSSRERNELLRKLDF